MSLRRLSFLIVSGLVMLTLIFFPGCGGEEQSTTPPPESTTPASTSPAAQSISEQIAAIEPSSPAALASLLSVAEELNSAQSEDSITEQEGEELGEDLGSSFNQYVRQLVDEIDPNDLGALNDFFKLQRVQRTDEYGEYCDSQTKQYKEDQMEDKFNDYIRNWVDQIDPTDPSALKDIFFLQKIQMCGKYQMASPETDQYKHEQMGNKFNQWVRNDLDNIDPSNPDDISEIVFLQKLQMTKKWEEYATPETEEYKHKQLQDKFNDWVRERVDELDPNDPNFQEELEKLRVLQRIEKYKELATPETHAYKEEHLAAKMGDYVTDAVDSIAPGLVQGVDELVALQRSTIYQQFCPPEVKEYKEEQLRAKFTTEPGMPPKLVGVLPENGGTEVEPSKSILLVFDQPMEPVSVSDRLGIVPAVDAELTWLEGNFVFLLELLEPLDFDTTYAVYLESGAESEAGLMLEESYDFSFTTKRPEEAPRVTETLPSDGQIDVSVRQLIEITFDQPMDPASVEAAITVSPAIDYLVYWQQDYTMAVLMPLKSMEFNTNYLVEIRAEATSADGLPLASGLNLQFVTGIVPAPHVTGTLPYDGQEDIPTGYPILIVFDWPMDPASVESALAVSPEVDYEIEWLEANFVMEFEPLTKLADHTIYTLEISEGAKSSDGLPLGDRFSLNFTTTAGRSTTE